MAEPRISSAVPSLQGEKRKLLRTYGRKRTSSSLDDTIPLSEKRRRLDEETPDDEPEKIVRKPTLPPSSNFEKGSILNYFKPSRSTSATGTRDLLNDKHQSNTESLPLSKPDRTQRMPRRLRLRPPTFDFESPESRDDNEDCISSSDPGEAPTVSGVQITIGIAGPRRSISDRTDWRPCGDLAARLEEGRPQGRPPDASSTMPPRSKSTPIQTTINLSTKPTFEECKVCRFVYNPLHPSDVKFHTKMHKLRVKNKR